MAALVDRTSRKLLQLYPMCSRNQKQTHWLNRAVKVLEVPKLES